MNRFLRIIGFVLFVAFSVFQFQNCSRKGFDAKESMAGSDDLSSLGVSCGENRLKDYQGNCVSEMGVCNLDGALIANSNNEEDSSLATVSTFADQNGDCSLSSSNHQFRTCTNGVLSGSNSFSNLRCAAGQSCRFVYADNTFEDVLSGRTIDVWNAASSVNCQKATLRCDGNTGQLKKLNGVASSFRYKSCATVDVPNSCLFNNVTYPGDGSLIGGNAYVSSSVPHGQACQLINGLKCVNGEFKDSSNNIVTPNLSCTVAQQTYASCSYAGESYGGNLVSISTPAFTSATVPYGQLCQQISGLKCSDGSLINGNGQVVSPVSSCTVSPPVEFGKVAAGGYLSADVAYYHSCFIQSDNKLFCNGKNSHKQVANATTVTITTPTLVAEDAERVEAGGFHTCYITTSGGLKCFGANGVGQLGRGTTTSSGGLSVGVVNNLESGVTKVSVGFKHSCAIKSGALYCWGENANGKIGDNSTTTRTAPVLISTDADNRALASTFTDVSAGVNSTCAINSGKLYCWGLNSSGQLGIGNTTSMTRPKEVTNMGSGVTSVAVGAIATCAVQNGAVKCWGADTHGALGNGAATTQLTSAPSESPAGLSSGVDYVFGGALHFCALKSGHLYCWGYNAHGQVGNGTTANQISPVIIMDNWIVKAVATGYYQSCGFFVQANEAPNGVFKCWGYGNYNNLSAGDRVQAPSDVKKDSAGAVLTY